MARYKLTEHGAIYDSHKRVCFGIDGRFWDAYQQWIAEGNTPDPYLPPDPMTDEDHIRAIMESTNPRDRAMMAILRAIPGNENMPDVSLANLLRAHMR